jgi:hypothetical protein
LRDNNNIFIHHDHGCMVGLMTPQVLLQHVRSEGDATHTAISILAGNVGDMLAKCRQYVKMLMNLGIFACRCRHQNSPDTDFWVKNFQHCTPYQNVHMHKDPMPTPKFFLLNFKAAVVAVAMVVARRQQQWQLQWWRRSRRWTRIGSKSGRQQEHQLLHDGMQ